MKILLVNKFHYLRGGAETYYFALAETLKKEGHEVYYFSMKDEKNFACEQSEYFVEGVDYNQKHGLIETLKISAKLIYSYEAAKKFEKLIKEIKPDIIHLSNIHRQLTLSIVDVAKKYNIPMVYTMHDLICACPNCVMLSPEGICEECIGGSYYKCIQKKCIKGSRLKSVLAVLEAYFYKIRKTYNKVDIYITPSEFYLNKLQKSKFTNKKIVHLKNFLEPSTQYRLTGKENGYYLFFGRLSIEKGIMTLVKAFEKMPADAILKIAGEGPQMDEIKEYIKTHRLEEKVVLLGYQQRDDMNRIIEGSKCVIVPSEWYENGPYTVMETLSKGIPVIASNNAGLPEMIKDGVNGMIFSAGDQKELLDKMLTVHNFSQEEYKLMCQNALDFAKREFSAGRYYSEIIPIYNSLINKRK